jgi:hypothetical protein
VKERVNVEGAALPQTSSNTGAAGAPPSPPVKAN